MRSRISIVMAAAAALALGACSAEKPAETPAAEASALPDTVLCSTSEEVLDLKTWQKAEPTVADAPVAGGAATVSGGSGQCPIIKYNQEQAPAELTVDVIAKGEGPEVKEGDWVTADYYGQVWNGDVFDTSFDRSGPSRFELVSGAGRGVIQGWVTGLAGTHVGDRVVVSIPAELGYGESSPSEKIPPNSTLVFVVDIVQSQNPDELLSASKGATESGNTDDLPVHVDGELGGEPALRFDEGAQAPAEPLLRVLADGTGAEVGEADTAVLSIVQASYDGTELHNSWKLRDLSATVPLAQNHLLKDLVGKKVGTRFLLLQPDDGVNGPSAAVAEIAAIVTTSR
ncbi:FKBP-type peptidyl-prolyl cis-trans isomerase [Buchananella felis]|uniref:FKBP-type peptidyl-prolyl cis-trans isomerase n=1 Tax=Buchananella felis TaxID=3231492 RepID=UPI0035271FAA